MINTPSHSVNQCPLEVTRGILMLKNISRQTSAPMKAVQQSSREDVQSRVRVFNNIPSFVHLTEYFSICHLKWKE